MKILTLGVLTYNNALYLPDLLASVKFQLVSDFKLIILDNGSTDNSFFIIEEFANTLSNFDYTLLHNESNSGSYCGIQQLIESTETEYLSIIHGDDVLKNNYVKSVLDFIELYPNHAAFNVDLEQIDSGGILLPEKPLKSNWSKSNFLNKLLVAGLNPGLMPGAVLNVKMLGANYLNGFSFGKKINGVEDIYLWLKITRDSKKVMRIPVVVYQYRRHSNQISNSQNMYASNLGYMRKLNFLTAHSRIEKLLAVAEIDYEYKLMNLNSAYLGALGSIIKFKKFSYFRFISIFLRRMNSVVQTTKLKLKNLAL